MVKYHGELEHEFTVVIILWYITMVIYHARNTMVNNTIVTDNTMVTNTMVIHNPMVNNTLVNNTMVTHKTMVLGIIIPWYY